MRSHTCIVVSTDVFPSLFDYGFVPRRAPRPTVFTAVVLPPKKHKAHDESSPTQTNKVGYESRYRMIHGENGYVDDG